MADTACPLQAVCITDPVLATHVLRSKHVDKLRFKYSFLDPVSLPRPSPAAGSLHPRCNASSQTGCQLLQLLTVFEWAALQGRQRGSPPQVTGGLT